MKKQSTNIYKTSTSRSIMTPVKNSHDAAASAAYCYNEHIANKAVSKALSAKPRKA
jgi:hypothetical protein